MRFKFMAYPFAKPDNGGEGGPPAGSPPAGSPPAGSPPAGAPPAGAPPAGAPPAGSPPAGSPPAGSPPGDGTPPGGQPPAEFTMPDLPDGYQIDDELTGAVKEAFGKLNDPTLTPEARNKLLLDTHMKVVQKQYQAWVDGFNKVVDGWEAEVMANPELSKPESLAIAKTGMEKFCTPRLIEALKYAGLTSHPDLIAKFYEHGKQYKEDPGSQGGPPSPAPSGAAKTLFGSVDK